jgi:hypothetical protein
MGNITNQVTFRNPRRTNKESYRDNLKVNLGTLLCRLGMIKDADQSVDQLQRAIISSYYQNCPVKPTRSPKTTPWWNRKLAKARKLFNSEKNRGVGHL